MGQHHPIRNVGTVDILFSISQRFLENALPIIENNRKTTRRNL